MKKENMNENITTMSGKKITKRLIPPAISSQ